MVARHLNFNVREFGALDYTDIRAFRRELHSLAARRGGGLLVQMGSVAGMGVIFDDMDAGGGGGTKIDKTLKMSQRAATTFARNASPTLLVIFVATATSRVSGLQQLFRRHESRIVPVTRPDNDLLLNMTREFTENDVLRNDLVTQLRPFERHDLHAARAALHARLHDTSTTPGSGLRDPTFHTQTTEALARLTMSTRDRRTRARIADTAPHSIAAYHAANVARLISSPADRITFARAQTVAVRCTVTCPFDGRARSIALWSGALAAPALRWSAQSGTRLSRRLVASRLTTLQRRYNASIKTTRRKI